MNDASSHNRKDKGWHSTAQRSTAWLARLGLAQHTMARHGTAGTAPWHGTARHGAAWPINTNQLTVSFHHRRAMSTSQPGTAPRCNLECGLWRTFLDGPIRTWIDPPGKLPKNLPSPWKVVVANHPPGHPSCECNSQEGQNQGLSAHLLHLGLPNLQCKPGSRWCNQPTGAKPAVGGATNPRGAT